MCVGAPLHNRGDSMGYMEVKNIRFYERYLLFSQIVFLSLLNIYVALQFVEDSMIIIGMTSSIIIYTFFIHYWLCRIGSNCDEYILPLVLVLSGISLVFVFTLRPDLIIRHYFSILWGMVVCYYIICIPKKLQLRKLIVPISIIGLVLLTATLAFGKEYGGSRRWLDLWVFTIQPCVFIYLIFTIFAPYCISRKTIRGVNSLFFVIGYWLTSSVIFVLQRDIGSLFIMMCILVVILYVTSQNILYLFGGGGLSVVMLIMAYNMFSYIQIRIDNWLNPWDDIYGRAHQIASSLFTIGDGGFLGSGIGSAQVIPAAHNDFIFSVFHGEMGFLAGVALIILYMILIYRGFRISMQAKDLINSLASVGITSMIGVQSFILIAGSTGFMPMSGVILPFMSFGGNGMIANYLAVALLIRMDDHKEGLL